MVDGLSTGYTSPSRLSCRPAEMKGSGSPAPWALLLLHSRVFYLVASLCAVLRAALLSRQSFSGLPSSSQWLVSYQDEFNGYGPGKKSPMKNKLEAFLPPLFAYEGTEHSSLLP